MVIELELGNGSESRHGLELGTVLVTGSDLDFKLELGIRVSIICDNRFRTWVESFGRTWIKSWNYTIYEMMNSIVDIIVNG